MQFLNNIRVGTKIILLVAVLLAILASVTALAVVQLKKIDDESNFMYNNNLMGLRWTLEANVQLIDLSRSVRNMALAPPERRPGYVAAFEGLVAECRQNMGKIKPLLLSEASLSLHSKTAAALEALFPRLQRIIDNIDTMNSTDIYNSLLAAREYANAADKLMTELGNYMTKAAETRNTSITVMAETSFIIMGAALLTALLSGAVLGMMIKKAIANPLVDIAQKAARVAGGDLGQDFAVKRGDELGLLAEALQQMVRNLRERIAEAELKSREAEEHSLKAREAMVEANAAKEKAEAGQQAILSAAEKVDMVVTRLSTATEELSAQVEESSRGTDVQRDRVTQAATAMEEMNQTVLEVAKNAGVAAEGSDRARQKAGQGADIVQESVRAINTVREDAEVLRNNMDQLGRQAESIGTIMMVISDIADQTNLLALNAAIEAARAGEAGRGFAVVADEVRKLAEKTMAATKEVGSSIGGIQTGTRQSISAVERTAENLRAATELVQKSGDALLEIVSEVNATASQVSSIATAAEEQSAASEEITDSLDEVNRMAVENATAMRQSAHAVSDLSHQARDLQNLVNLLRNSSGSD